MTYAETLTSNYRKFQDAAVENGHKAWDRSVDLFEQARKSDTWNELAERGRKLPEQTAEQFEVLQERLEPGLKKLGSRLENGAIVVFHRLGLPHAHDVAKLADRVEDLAKQVDSLKEGMRAELVSVYLVRPAEAGWELASNQKGIETTPFSTKREALTVGRRLAKQNEPSELVVHKKDGSVQDTFRYGEL